MISQEILEQAAHDSALVQRIELMVWRYMDQEPMKRDAITLAMAIISEVRDADGKPSGEEVVKATEHDMPFRWGDVPNKNSVIAPGDGERQEPASQDAKDMRDDVDASGAPTMYIRWLYRHEGLTAPRIAKRLRDEGIKVSLGRVYNIVTKP